MAASTSSVPEQARVARRLTSEARGHEVPPAHNATVSRSRSVAGQKWTRLAHVYTSMIALLVVLFFGITGLTLNHPSWTLGFDPSRSTTSGTLPEGAIARDGTVEFLRVSEYLRAEEDVRGSVTDFGAEDGEGRISYRGPGYAAEVTFEIESGRYEVAAERQGFIGVMNDLHKGRDTNTSWSWLIDVSAVFLVAISATGLILQLFLKRRRTSALVVAAVGVTATVAVAVTTLL